MRYTVYTDGAYHQEKGVCGCAYLILTDKTYVSSDSIRVDSIKSATHAETLSVALAAAYLLDNKDLKDTDIVEFNIDCVGAIEFYNKYYDNDRKIAAGPRPIVNGTKVIRDMAKLCTVRFLKVRGHKEALGPNKVVDRMAKIAVRRE